MKETPMVLRNILLVAVLWACLPTTPAWGWGEEAHRLISGYAVDLTRGSLGEFLRLHRQRIVDLSIDADQRRNHSQTEGPNHYIDLEYYGNPPGSEIPFSRQEAVAQYGEDNMAKWGVLPWNMIDVALALRDAMGAGEWDQVVVLAADLGHYVADSHQPLHTTANYNGQLSGNKGVHSMFETFMVNRYINQFHRPIPPLPVIGGNGMPDSIFIWLVDSFREVERILVGDTWAREGLNSQTEALLAQGDQADPKAIPKSYLERLYLQTGLIAWRRMSKATVRLTALWLWAWNEAGQPLPPR
ncbi:MAG: hypothetical protein JSW54_13930 [Fidelibacterota bacterium]|nr:MAG: hypothetical protein JSW54_13930 [Candidatus Neomarinimicrobiota bacterium]